MKPSNPRILTVNGGSSSIKFALFEAGDSLRQMRNWKWSLVKTDESA